MPKISIKTKGKITPEQLILLQKLQEDCDDYILDIIKKPAYNHLKVLSSYSVEDRKVGDDCFLLSDNSKLKIKNSLKLANAVNDFLKDSNIDVILPDNKLRVNLDIIEKDMKTETNEKKDDSLPIFFRRNLATISIKSFSQTRFEKNCLMH